MRSRLSFASAALFICVRLFLFRLLVIAFRGAIAARGGGSFPHRQMTSVIEHNNNNSDDCILVADPLPLAQPSLLPTAGQAESMQHFLLDSDVHSAEERAKGLSAGMESLALEPPLWGGLEESFFPSVVPESGQEGGTEADEGSGCGATHNNIGLRRQSISYRERSPSCSVSDDEEEEELPVEPATAPSDGLSATLASSESSIAPCAAFHGERYAAFVRSYFNLTAEEAAREKRHLRKSFPSAVRVIRKSKRGRSRLDTMVTADYACRHTVVAVEGDYLFSRFVQQARDPLTCTTAAKRSSRSGSNARCIALHFGFPSSGEGSGEGHDPHSIGRRERDAFPRVRLLAIVTATCLEKNTEIVLDLASYLRCLDEPTWYQQQQYGASSSPHSHPPNPRIDSPLLASSSNSVASSQEDGLHGGDVSTGYTHFSLWPGDLAYYHGVGARYRCRVPQASYPFTLIRIKAATEIGPTDLGVYAAAFIPYGTCFFYGGSVATAGEHRMVVQAKMSSSTPPSTPIEDWSDDTYSLGLDDKHMCFGQNATRYINHRYNLTRFGNVELCSLFLSVLCAGYGSSNTPSSKKSTASERTRMISIPFFMTTTDVEPSSPLLAWTYGEEYDSKLERTAVCDDALVPHMYASLLNRRLKGVQNGTLLQRYTGDYRSGLRCGDVVWRPSSMSIDTLDGELYVVDGVQPHAVEYVLLQPIQRCLLSESEWRDAYTLKGKKSSLRSSSASAKFKYADHFKFFTIPKSRKWHKATGASNGSSGGGSGSGTSSSSCDPSADARSISTTSAIVPLVEDTDYFVTNTSESGSGQPTQGLIISLDLWKRSAAHIYQSKDLAPPPLIHPSLWMLLKNAQKP